MEKAQEQYNEEEARLSKKIAKNQFDFDDFMSQIQQIKKWVISKTWQQYLGMGKQLKDIDIDDNAFKGIEAIISLHDATRTQKSVGNEWEPKKPDRSL